MQAYVVLGCDFILSHQTSLRQPRLSAGERTISGIQM
jgi:hypothetical protein